MNTEMLMMILSQTPTWVWGLLALLLVLGLQQTRERWVSERRLRTLPLAFLGLSVWSQLTAFGWQPMMLLGFGLSFVLCKRLVQASGWPGPARFDSQRGLYRVTGSWVPLALMMGIFLLKYAMGIALAMSPQLRELPAFVLSASALSGSFSAVFLARARRLLGESPSAAVAQTA